MDTNIETRIIYIPLLNEGTYVIRPTKGIKIGKKSFKVLPTEDYDSENEEWMFPPGTKVECDIEINNGENVLIAKSIL